MAFSDWVAVLLPLAGVWFIAVISPGPNFIAVAQAAVTEGRRAAFFTALGTVAGTTLWGIAGLFGLHALFSVLPVAADVVRVGGALYLLYVAWRAWQAGNRPPVLDGLSRRGGSRRAFLRGLATNLSNPKTAAFAASLFAVAVPEGAPLTVYLAALATIVSVSAGWYLVFAQIVSTRGVRGAFERLHRPLHRVMAFAFAGFGLKLLLARSAA